MDENFEEITKQFQTVARANQLPEEITSGIIDINRGLSSGIGAFVTWKLWYNALPGDPIGNLTITDIQKMFQRGADDWKRTLKASDYLWKYLNDTANIDRAADRARKFDWQGLRNSIASSIGNDRIAAEDSLSYLGTPISLAQKGLVRELTTESLRQYGDCATAHATLLSELERGGLARLALASSDKGYSPYARAGAVAAFWTVAFTATAVVCAVGSMPVAAGVAAASAIGYFGYTHRRLREDPDYSPIQ